MQHVLYKGLDRRDRKPALFLVRVREGVREVAQFAYVVGALDSSSKIVAYVRKMSTKCQFLPDHPFEDNVAGLIEVARW